MQTTFDFQNTISKSRHNIRQHYTTLGEELNIASQFRHSVQRKPWAWMGGATLAGITTAFLGSFRGPKNSETQLSETFTSTPTSSAGFTKEALSRTQKATSVAALILGSEGLRAALVPTLSFLFPYIKPVITSYATRKMNQMFTTKE